MKYISLLALSFVMFGLSACETAKGTARDIQVVGENIGAVATGDVVPPYDEEGNPQLSIGRMPTGYNYADNSSHLAAASHNQRVDLYYPSTGQRAGHGAPSAVTIPSYAGGINTSDSSVTIYPLNQEMENIFRGHSPAYNTMGQQNFVPQGSLAPLPNMGFGSDEQIFFRNGSSRLGAADRMKIEAVADNKKMMPGGTLTVEGHASHPARGGGASVNGKIANLKESMNRSFAVSSALMKEGVSPDSIKTVSWGSARATGNDEQDRRVDISMGER